MELLLFLKYNLRALCHGDLKSPPKDFGDQDQRQRLSAVGAKSLFQPFPAHIQTTSRFSNFLNNFKLPAQLCTISSIKTNNLSKNWVDGEERGWRGKEGYPYKPRMAMLVINTLLC